jgi:hypothetical protein
MVKFYYNMIILGRITIEQVPIQYREQVQEMLDK